MNNKNNLNKIGLYKNNYGKLYEINGNLFAKQILKDFQIVSVQHTELYFYEDGYYIKKENNELSAVLRDYLHSFIPNSWTEKFEKSYLSALRLEAPSFEAMNQDKYILNLKNCLIDLKKLKILKHTPDFISSIRLPVSYDSKAECPLFMKFLNEVFENNNELISLIQEIFGYCLTPFVNSQKAFILVGEGSNGKSVLLDILESLAGGNNNVSHIPLNDLSRPFARYNLIDKLINIITEVEINSKYGLNSEFFKNIVAGDTINCEKKNKAEHISFNPICKIIMACNELPFTMDKSYGFKRRLIIIPFNRIFKEHEQDKLLSGKLKKELDGIFLWSLKGLKRLMKNHFIFTAPEESNKLLNDYIKTINPIVDFVEENLILSVSRIPYKALLERFTGWCSKENIKGYENLSTKIFIKRLLSALKQKNYICESIKSNGERFITNISFI